MYWGEQIRPYCQGNSRPGANCQRGVQRISALCLEDNSKLPTTHKTVPLKRKLVKSAESKAIAYIELRQSVIAARVIGVLNSVCFARRKRVVVERLGIRVGGKKLQAARHMLVRCDPNRVVMGVASAVDLVDGSIGAVRIWGLALRRNDGAGQRQCREWPSRTVEPVGDERLVDVLRELQVRPLHAYIGNLQSEA